MANISRSRKSGLFLRGGKSVRETSWVASEVVQGVMAAPSTAILLTQFAADALALRPFTIVRTRGVLYGRSDQSSVSEDYSVSYGHCVVADQAVAIGVTAVPTPMSDSPSDLWFVYETIIGQLLVTTDISRIEPGSMVKFDSKAMRKVEDGQNAISVVETSSLSNGVLVQALIRCLIKLH